MTSSVDALASASKASLAEAQNTVAAGRTQGAAKLFTTALDAKTATAAIAETGTGEAAKRVYRGSRSGELTPEKQFESFMLRSFVEEMLPSENSAFFGDGTAGKIWKSMLAERIGEEMAAAGGIGIAEMVAKHAAGEVARAAGETMKSEAAAASSANAEGGLTGL